MRKVIPSCDTHNWISDEFFDSLNGLFECIRLIGFHKCILEFKVILDAAFFDPSAAGIENEWMLPAYEQEMLSIVCVIVATY